MRVSLQEVPEVAMVLQDRSFDRRIAGNLGARRRAAGEADGPRCVDDILHGFA
jgi:hypothetical protein